MATRNEILREMGLLPVWRSRVPRGAVTAPVERPHFVADGEVGGILDVDDTQALRARKSVPAGRLRSALVLAEVAATVTLLVGGGLLVKAMWRVQAVDLGFHAEGVLTLRTVLSPIKYPTYAHRLGFYYDVLSRTRALPGVVSAGYTTGLPLVVGFGVMMATVPSSLPTVPSCRAPRGRWTPCSRRRRRPRP